MKNTNYLLFCDREDAYDLALLLTKLKSFETYPQSSTHDGARDDTVQGSIPDSGLTHFSSVENTIIQDVKDKLVLDKTNYQLIHNDDLSIVKFLERPYLAGSGSMAVTDTATTFGNIEWGSNTQVTMLKEKLNGVMVLKATLVVEITFNANRFQAGRYILGYIPTGGQRTTVSTNTNWINMKKFTKRQVTQLPHVQFDLNTTKSAVLRIPWAAGHTAALNSPITSFTNPGYAFLYPYVPLTTTAGTATVGYNIFIHYEDIVLGGATIPQSGMDELDREVNQRGPISGGLKLASDVSGALSTIPLLSSIAGPISWFTDVASNIAHSFGWSKPISLDRQTRIVSFAQPYLGNSDGHSTALPLSLVSTNHVGVAPGFGGTNMDELSIDFLKSVKCWLGTVPITTANAYGTLISTLDLTPNIGKSVVADGTVNLTSYTPVAYLAELHTYYTGSINFHLKFVKTEFHTGRLAVCYIPYDGETTQPVVTVGQTPYVHRDIIDLSQGNEWNFNFPFISTTPWRETGPSTGAYGRMSIYVIDPLVAPATVSSTIQMIVETSGGEDLQFAAPDAPALAAVVPSSPQSGMALLEAESKAIGNSSIQKKNFDPNQLAQGQAVTSLRQHLKRGDQATNLTTMTSAQVTNLYPFLWLPFYSNGTAMTGSPSFDIYSQLSTIYALSRGGVRIRILPRDNPDSTLIAGCVRYENAASSSVTLTSIANIIAGTVILFKSISAGTSQFRESLVGGIDVQIPQSSATVSRISSANTTTSTGVYSYAAQLGDRAVLWLKTLNSVGTPSMVFDVYRSGADDCNFGLFTGIPPMFPGNYTT